MRYLLCTIALLLLGIATASALIIEIETDAPAVIDAEKYHTIQIMPLEDKSDDGRISSGLIATASLRQLFRQDGRFAVVSDDELDRASEMIEDYSPSNRQHALDVAKEINAQIVICGSVKFTAFAYSQLGYLPNEGYSADRYSRPSVGGGSTGAMQQPAHIRYNLSLSLTTIEVKSGVVLDRQNIQKASVKENTSGDSWDVDQRRHELNSLLEDAVKDFESQLHPHRIKRERKLVSM